MSSLVTATRPDATARPGCGPGIDNAPLTGAQWWLDA
jgi:hypothetical protein